MHDGQILASDPPVELFQRQDVLDRTSLAAPPVLTLAQALAPFGMRGDSLTVESFCDEFVALSKGRTRPGSDEGTLRGDHEPGL
jgi:hypothetical protein